MFVGHYGVSFAARKIEPAIPLWVLFIAVQLLDVAWAPYGVFAVVIRLLEGRRATPALNA